MPKAANVRQERSRMFREIFPEMTSLLGLAAQLPGLTVLH